MPWAKKKQKTPSQNFQIGLLLCGEICDCKTQSKYGNIKRLEVAMISDIRECIKPISYVKSNAADMMNFVNDRKKNGHKQKHRCHARRI